MKGFELVIACSALGSVLSLSSQRLFCTVGKHPTQMLSQLLCCCLHCPAAARAHTNMHAPMIPRVC